MGNPPDFEPSSVSPMSQSSSSGFGPVTLILLHKPIERRRDIWTAHVSSLAKERSVAWGDLYLSLMVSLFRYITRRRDRSLGR